MSNLSNLLIDDIRRELLNGGISVIWPDSDIPLILDVDGESVKPAILPAPTQYGLNPDFHAIWCMSDDDTHYGPCEGKWDILAVAGIADNRRMRDITAKHDMCGIDTLTVAQAADGSTRVEIIWNWNNVATDAYFADDPIAVEATHTVLTHAIARVLASIRFNRLQHA